MPDRSGHRRRGLRPAWVLAVFVLLGCSRADRTPAADGADSNPSRPPAGEAAPTVAEADWPLFRGDPQASGAAHAALPEKLRLLWTFSLDKGGFESSAAIVDRTVFVGSTEGKFYALDLASGKKKWEHATELGFSASPAVHDGRVYVGDVDGRFYCLDAASGRLKWHFDAQAEINSSANFHGDHVLFGSQDAALYCLDAQTGRLAWKYESADQIRCCPTVVEDRALVAGCDGRLHAIDLNTGKEAGNVDLEGPTGCTPAVLGPTAFVGTEGRTFLAVDWKQLKIVWRYEDARRSAPIRSSAAVTSEVVVFGARDRQVRALDPKTGQARWAFTTRGQVDGSPVIVGRRVFVGASDGRLYALDLATGQAVWQFEAGGSLLASPAVAAARLVIGTDDGNLYCFGE